MTAPLREPQRHNGSSGRSMHSRPWSGNKPNDNLDRMIRSTPAHRRYLQSSRTQSAPQQKEAKIQRGARSISSASRQHLASLPLYFSKRCTPSNRVQDSSLSPFYRDDTMVLSPFRVMDAEPDISDVIQ